MNYSLSGTCLPPTDRPIRYLIQPVYAGTSKPPTSKCGSVTREANGRKASPSMPIDGPDILEDCDNANRPMSTLTTLIKPSKLFPLHPKLIHPAEGIWIVDLISVPLRQV